MALHRVSPAESLQAKVRAEFIRYLQAHGRCYPRVRPADRLGPVRECWSNAWHASPLGYAEGVARTAEGRWIAHAWGVAPDDAAVEVSSGCESLTDYRGLPLHRPTAARMSRIWQGPRSSLIEAGICAGLSPAAAIQLLQGRHV